MIGDLAQPLISFLRQWLASLDLLEHMGHARVACCILADVLARDLLCLFVRTPRFVVFFGFPYKAPKQGYSQRKSHLFAAVLIVFLGSLKPKCLFQRKFVVSLAVVSYRKTQFSHHTAGDMGHSRICCTQTEHDTVKCRYYARNCVLMV